MTVDEISDIFEIPPLVKKQKDSRVLEAEWWFGVADREDDSAESIMLTYYAEFESGKLKSGSLRSPYIY
jgi:hypothetical protein